MGSVREPQNVGRRGVPRANMNRSLEGNPRYTEAVQQMRAETEGSDEGPVTRESVSAGAGESKTESTKGKAKKDS